MIEIRLLDPSAYHAAYEIDATEGDGGFEHFAACLARPNYLNFGVYDAERLIAVVSLERLGSVAARFHVAKLPRTLRPDALAGLLTQVGDYLFSHGFTLAEAGIPVANRAAARLAIRCGMRQVGIEDNERIFQITRHQHYEFQAAKSSTDAV